MRKKCKYCGKVKSLSKFNRNKGYKDGYQPRCKECSAVANKKWYLKNKEKVVKKRAEKIKEHRKFIQQVKSDIGCIKCGEKDGCALDFHHLKDKKFNVSHLGYKGKLAILEEMKKCIILCANCHRKLHAGRFSL